MRILILRGGALGDFLVTIPALQLLRSHWPAARIEVAGNARAAELAVLIGLIDGVHSQHEARWSALFGAEPLGREFSMWLDSFDLVISYWPDVDGALREKFSHRKKSFLASSARATTRPAAKHFCDALAAIGLSTVDFRVRISLPEPTIATATNRLGGFKDFIAIHPGSGSAVKNWPIDRWTTVCSKLRKPLLVVTGEAERTPISWPEDIFVQHAHQWPLPLLAGALTRATLYLGHDSGVSHLAASVGGKCLLLFGPTDPEIWAPPGENVTVVKRGPGLGDIAVEDVMSKLAAA